MPFVAKISFLTGSGKSRKGTNSGQLRSPIATIAGYLPRQVAANSAKRISAAVTVAAV